MLPIGGLKEKLLSALRGGIKTVIIPKENEKDLEEIPENVKTGMKIIPVSDVKEVIKIAPQRQGQAAGGNLPLRTGAKILRAGFGSELNEKKRRDTALFQVCESPARIAEESSANQAGQRFGCE